MIHIHAQGKGGLIAAIGVISFTVVFVSTNIVLGYTKTQLPDVFYQFLGGVSFMLAGIMSGIVLKTLSHVEDEGSDFMYLPVKFWPHIYLIGGLILAVEAASEYYR
ncbi:MAG TPA: hypothetical protein VK154_02205 [Chitinophagales bacterium]|nr:hypothetical protein [Chitinophagales bacterium]